MRQYMAAGVSQNIVWLIMLLIVRSSFIFVATSDYFNSRTYLKCWRFEESCSSNGLVKYSRVEGIFFAFMQIIA